MVEKVMDDSVEPIPAIIDAYVVASVDVKPIVDVKVKVTIPFEAHIEEKLKPTGVVAKLHGYEVNTASFFFNKWKMARAR